MLSLKDFMETVNYRITEGSEYGWNCYGSSAYTLDSWNGKHTSEGHSLHVIFDTETQVIYEMTACDYARDRAYRLINPMYVSAFNKEQAQRGFKDEAWEEVPYIDIEDDADFLEKASAIVAGVPYDDRVQIPIDLPDDVLLQLMKAAHEKDITFNEFICEKLREYIAVNSK